MTITFISNYINHHQIPFTDACYELCPGFSFIQTEAMEQERIAMGWHTEGTSLPYVHCLYEEEALCRKLVMESDILIAGWSDREDLIQERLRGGKPVIRISERLYREGQWKAVSPRGLLQKYKDHTRYRKDRVYLLCAGAYVPSDFHIIRAYPGKMYRWGYFPETRHYPEEMLLNMKYGDGRLHIVWAGRFIPLKHPEYMIRLAAFLKANSTAGFHIHMAGSGEMEESLKAMAKEEKVEDVLTFYGFLPPERVREIMEKCHIHVFTSNHLEGWGAVVNESMNSGCAVVANVEAGAVPSLIVPGKNGMIYNRSFEEMASQVLYLFSHKEERQNMGRAAYETITGLWNAEHGAKELIRFAGEILEGEPEPAAEGPLSPAPVIAPGKMYGELKRKGRI
jgi:glycosyltransferase involved in cell wall biosynthesis